MIEAQRPRRRRPPQAAPKKTKATRIPVTTYVFAAFASVAAALIIWLLALVAYWIAPAGAPVSVPDFVGMTYDTAAATATSKHLSIRSIAHRADSKAAKDTIIGQLPYAGEHVREGRAILVIVSDGSPTAQVPNVSGMTQREATVALENQRLEVGKVSRRFDTGVVAGTVIQQDIDALTAVPVGSKVDITVATGRPLRYTPPFVGLPLTVVEAAAKENGIALDKPAFLPPAPSAPPKGIIIAQNPVPGTMLDSTTKISLDVSGGPIPTPTPTGNLLAAPALPNPDSMRGLRVSVNVPSENPPAQVRIVVQDATGARTIWNQATGGGQTLWFDLGVTGSATLETYVNDQLVSAVPI